MLRQPIRIQPFHRGTGGCMYSLAAWCEEALVGDVLGQDILEHIDGFLCSCALKKKLQSLQLRQQRCEHTRAVPDDRQQSRGKLSSQDRSRLQQLLVRCW